TVINFFVSWLFEAPFAYFLGITMGFGPKGIFSAIAVTLVIWAIVSIIIFKRGKWKLVEV
ncbi:MAG: MATE family efflux transporter, partial [Bacteroidota bacterium]